jgi:hypothetical protein
MNYSKLYESIIDRAKTRELTGYIEHHTLKNVDLIHQSVIHKRAQQRIKSERQIEAENFHNKYVLIVERSVQVLI